MNQDQEETFSDDASDRLKSLLEFMRSTIDNFEAFVKHPGVKDRDELGKAIRKAIENQFPEQEQE